MPDRRTLLLVTSMLLLAALPGIAHLAGEPFLVSVASRMLIFGLAAASLDLILGYGGMVSFGHAAWLGVGAYVVGILSTHASEDSLLLGFLPGTHSAWLAWPLATALSGLAAMLVGSLALRTSGVHFIMITLAFAQMLFFFFQSLEGYGGDDGLGLWERSRVPGLDLHDDISFYYVCLVLLVAFLLLARRLVNSRFGMVVRGCKQNERRMRALGFATFRYKLVCFGIAGAGAGLAGALLANHTEFVSPAVMHWTRSGELMVMVILGGMGTLFGPVLGAIALLALEESLAAWTEHWMIVLGPLLVLVVLFARRGLWGWLTGRNSIDE